MYTPPTNDMRGVTDPAGNSLGNQTLILYLFAVTVGPSAHVAPINLYEELLAGLKIIKKKKKKNSEPVWPSGMALGW